MGESQRLRPYFLYKEQRLYKKHGRKQCEAPILYKRDLDEIMRKLFSTLIPLLKDAFGSLHGALAQALEEKQTEDIPELERQIAALEQKKKKLLDGWMNNVVSDSDYQDMRKRLEQQIEELNERILQSEKASVEPNVSAASFAIMQKAISNTNLDSEEMLDELVRCFVYKIVVKRKEDAEATGKKVPYMLEIWLQNAQTPANFDLALCERTRLWQPTKSIFLKKMDFSLQNTKQPVKWSPDVSIHVLYPSS